MVIYFAVKTTVVLLVEKDEIFVQFCIFIEGLTIFTIRLLLGGLLVGQIMLSL